MRESVNLFFEKIMGGLINHNTFSINVFGMILAM